MVVRSNPSVVVIAVTVNASRFDCAWPSSVAATATTCQVPGVNRGAVGNESTPLGPEASRLASVSGACGDGE